MVERTRTTMYYEDLALCDYHSGPYDARAWQSPLRAIGWLEHPHPFPAGPTPPQFLERLEALIAASWAHYPYFAFRGLHECSLCEFGDRKPSRPVRSDQNLWIPGDRIIYIAPGMITHFVGDHQYHPPDEFIDAVLSCPDYGSPAYCAALRRANSDAPPPLLTKAEVEAECTQMLQHNQPLGKNEFRCVRCGGIIKQEDESCRICGWTLK